LPNFNKRANFNKRTKRNVRINFNALTWDAASASLPVLVVPEVEEEASLAFMISNTTESTGKVDKKSIANHVCK
jgi:autotransporter translocation and assembly factor TamB